MVVGSIRRKHYSVTRNQRRIFVAKEKAITLKNEFQEMSQKPSRALAKISFQEKQWPITQNGKCHTKAEEKADMEETPKNPINQIKNEKSLSLSERRRVVVIFCQ